MHYIAHEALFTAYLKVNHESSADIKDIVLHSLYRRCIRKGTNELCTVKKQALHGQPLFMEQSRAKECK